MPPRVIQGVEELQSLVGQEVAASDWFEVTQSRINDFADATEDHQWIHIDVDRAKTDSPFHSTIAHGFLSLSMLPHLAAQALKVQGDFKMGINYGLNRLRARNTSEASENKIHDDATAASFGFRGGLVPGVTVYAYMTVPIVEQFGLAWLERGSMQVKFHQPFYDGEEVIVRAEADTRAD